MSRPAVIIRQADAADVAGIARIHVDAWRAAYRDILSSGFLAALSVEARAAHWADTIADADSTTLLAEHDGQVIGFAHVRAARDDDLDPATTDELTAIYLAPDVWRQGFGTTLIGAARAAMTDAGHSTGVLWVLDRNVDARRFYASDGWQPDGRVRRSTIGGKDVAQTRLIRRVP